MLIFNILDLSHNFLIQMYDREAEKGKKINERGILIGESTVLQQ